MWPLFVFEAVSVTNFVKQLPLIFITRLADIENVSGCRDIAANLDDIFYMQVGTALE